MATYCAQCGSPVPDGANVCPECGTPVVGAGFQQPQQQYQQPQQPQQPQQQYQEPQPQYQEPQPQYQQPQYDGAYAPAPAPQPHSSGVNDTLLIVAAVLSFIFAFIMFFSRITSYAGDNVLTTAANNVSRGFAFLFIIIGLVLLGVRGVGGSSNNQN